MEGNTMYEDSPNISISTGEESEEETPPPAAPRGYAFENGAFIWHNGTGQSSPVSCEAMASNLNEQITRANKLSEQISGDDYRLTDFWEKAQELADRAGHCSVYDEIAEALGGPARARDYDVTVTYSATWTVSARDEQSAIDYATEAIEDAYTIGDLYVENTYVEEA